MKAEKVYIVWVLFSIFLLSRSTDIVAQTYERTFKFYFAEEEFTLESNEEGDYLIPDSKLYNWSYGKDANNPALPYINYQILLPDNYKIKTFSPSVGMTAWMPYEATLAANPQEVPTSIDENNLPYPIKTYNFESFCTSEEIMDGYRIANFSICPFTYYADTKKLKLATSFGLNVIIEPVSEDDKMEHVGTMKDIVKNMVYNPEDMEQGTKRWRISETDPTLCTVGHIYINLLNTIENKYTKDWNIRFAAPKKIEEIVQLGIIKDSVPNKTGYITIECKKNRIVTDSLLYRQIGQKVYRYSDEKKKDILLFDFGLNAGDDFTTPKGEVWTVEAIEETDQYGGRTGRTFTLKGKEDGMIKDIWLEHVGSLYTGILTYDDLGGSSSLPQLVYCRQGDTTPWLFNVNTEHFKIVYFSNLYDFEEYDFLLSPEEIAYFESGGREDHLYADFEGDTLHVYGKMGMNCYHYPMECRITDDEILLKVDEIHYGEQFDCHGGYYVDIRIPDVKAGEYTIRYAPMFSEYSGEEQILKSSPHHVAHLPKLNTISINRHVITCTSPTAVKFEVFTIDAVKVGEASFINGEAVVKVNKTPAIYLYIVTYPDGRRESGKVGVK